MHAAVGCQRRTVQAWVDAAGGHCQRLHEQRALQPRDLQHVQADELRVTTQRGVLWMAMAGMVSTRLWLGGARSPARDTRVIRALVAITATSALPRPLLLGTEGLLAYAKAFRRALRTPLPRGRRGRPRLLPWRDVVSGQVGKPYRQRRVVGVVQRLVQGSARLAQHLIRQTQGAGVLNTASIERLNATFRARLAVLVRRTRGTARRQVRLQAGMSLVGTVYNFCTYHASLTLRDVGLRTPALAAGITDQCGSVSELLHERVPPPRWQPPKRRGRRSNALQQLVDRWCT